MKRRSEQYTQGRFRKYVADMKRMRKRGDALVLYLFSESGIVSGLRTWSLFYLQEEEYGYPAAEAEHGKLLQPVVALHAMLSSGGALGNVWPGLQVAGRLESCGFRVA